MKDEPTIEQMNEVIAMFMGLTPIPAGTKRLGDIKHPEISAAFLRYHSSWDSLMPVWFKCQDIGADLGRAFEKFHNAFHAGIDLKDIDKCHNALYQFIQWYNKNTNNDTTTGNS